MSERPFMQLYVSDFIGDTLQLSTEQIGAYMLLLMAMWNAGGKLPSDEAKLARVTRMSLKKWKTIADDLMPFFEVDGETVRHNRLTKELQKSESKSQSRAAAGAEGGKAKALKDNEARMANAMRSSQHLPDTITREESSSLCSEDMHAPPKATPRSELSASLDPKRTQAVIEHRTRIGKPLTAHAAHLLAGKFARCPDPNAAADAMVSNGWQGFEPEWMDRRTAQRGQPPPSGTGNAMVDRLDELMNGMGQRNADERRTIEGSNEHGAYDRAPQAVLGPAASQGRR